MIPWTIAHRLSKFLNLSAPHEWYQYQARTGRPQYGSETQDDILYSRLANSLLEPMLWLYNQFSEAEIDVASYFSLAGDVNEIALDHLLLQKLISLEEPRKFSNNAITIRCISNYIGQKHQERKKEIADIWFQISTKILFENSTFNLNKLALFQSKQLFPTIIPNG